MTTPNAPRGVRIVHPDGTATPVEVEFIGTEPREAYGDIFIVDIWQVTTVVSWDDGDRLDFDWRPDMCVIRTYRVGVR